ncbi:MAG TPA: sorbosone dehydrogenase family protein [Anaerolineae bacterium]|nr:sorbosone dehydrogenase family protein [Anaerolineae bacterium]
MSQRLMIYWLVMILIILALAACAGANQYSSSASTPVLQAEAEPEAATQAAELPYEITLPPSFEISLYASDVPNARSLALSPNGTLFVGTRTAGNLYAVLDHNQDYQADEVITLQRGMNSPNGVALRDGALYVAEINRILRYDNIEANLNNLPQPVVINDSFPSERAHGWKFIRFGPDGKLYVPVGMPCNVCEPNGEWYGTITRMNPDGTGLEIFARGVRNSVGFDWDPATGELWFTDNGRDEMGDDLPPDELNHAPQPGLDFGFPYCHGGEIPDPEFGQQHPCEEFTPPAHPLGPHVAALGMRFYTGAMFPEEYRNQIFIAEHGSWNRSEPIGYRIMLVRVENNRAVSYEVFAEGWLRGSQAWGRPVDLLVMPDGSMLVSDDEAGAIYRITYKG